MTCQCEAGVAKPWHPFLYLCLLMGGMAGVFSVFLFVAFHLSEINTLLTILVSITIICLGAFLVFFIVFRISNRLSSKQKIKISDGFIEFSRYGKISLENIKSYDTNVSDYRNRLYLVIRPKGRMSLRILSGPQADFAEFCRAFERQVALRAQRMSLVANIPPGDNVLTRFLRLLYLGQAERPVPPGVPVKRSFYGSPLARLIGVLGLAALGGGVIGALLVDPALAVYALLLAVAGGAPMLILALGGRAE